LKHSSKTASQSDVGGSLLLWQWGESEVWLDDAEVREEGLGLLVLDGWSNDNIITWYPVDWGSDSVLVTGLEGVDDTEDLSGVTAGGGWVCENETDGLLWVDDEDRADGESNALLVDVGDVLVVKHVVEVCYLALLVSNDWESELGAGDLIDILDPSSVAINGVGRQANELDTTFGELWLKLGKGTKLGGADWSVILWVREENNPLVTDELVEIDRSVGGLSLEVWGNGAQTEWDGSLLSRHFE